MTPAVKLALAYAHVTGKFPKNIHIGTWGKAYKLVEGVSIDYKLKPEAIEAVLDHPFVIGDAYMRSIGFLPERDRRTSHSISYRNDDDIRGGISRDGSGWIWRKHTTKPGSETEYLTLEQMKTALKEIADANSWYSATQLDEITAKEASQ